MMSMDLNEISIFIKVAQLESFSRAAALLNLPKSTVSTKINSLEKRLGVSLIHRTTRRINLTPVGKQFYERCLGSIENLKTAEDEITFTKKNPSGKIVVSAPVFLGSYLFPEVLQEYKKDFPDVHVELILTDAQVDLIKDGIDLALRGGHLEDSSLLSKKIGVSCFGLFASQEYLKRNKNKMNHPKDLKNHLCLQFSHLGKEKWVLSHSHDKQSVSIPMNQNFVADDLFVIKEMTLKSQGIALLPSFICHDDVKNKDLVPVLPQWRTEVKPISFVYPASRYTLPKVKGFMEKAEKYLKSNIIL